MPLRWLSSWRMVASLVSNWRSPRKVIGGRVVETQLARLDHQHHLDCDHRLGDARDRELVVDLEVSDTVGLARRPTPRALGCHHRG